MCTCTQRTNKARQWFGEHDYYVALCLYTLYAKVIFSNTNCLKQIINWPKITLF